MCRPVAYYIEYEATKFFTIQRRDTWDHSIVSLTYLVDEHSALPAPIAWTYNIIRRTTLFTITSHGSQENNANYVKNTHKINKQ